MAKVRVQISTGRLNRSSSLLGYFSISFKSYSMACAGFIPARIRLKKGSILLFTLVASISGKRTSISSKVNVERGSVNNSLSLQKWGISFSKQPSPVRKDEKIVQGEFI